LQTEDLIDFYLPRDHKILRTNIIKNLLSFTRNYQLVKDTFKGIGSYDILPLPGLNDFEKLAKYYLVWCKINSNKENSYSGSGTINYAVHEYIEVFEDQKIRSILSCSDKVSNIIQKLKYG
jgi:hypothetical protein